MPTSRILPCGQCVLGSQQVASSVEVLACDSTGVKSFWLLHGRMWHFGSVLKREKKCGEWTIQAAYCYPGWDFVILRVSTTSVSSMISSWGKNETIELHLFSHGNYIKYRIKLWLNISHHGWRVAYFNQTNHISNIVPEYKDLYLSNEHFLLISEHYISVTNQPRHTETF